MTDQKTIQVPKPAVSQIETRVVENGEVALAVAPSSDVAGVTPQDYRQEIAMINQLERLRLASEVFSLRTELIEKCRRDAIKSTDPEDWVLFRDRDGSVTGRLCASGADKVAVYYGISVYNFRPIVGGVFSPLEEKADGKTSFTGWCDAETSPQVTGQRIENVRLTRTEGESFLGRGTFADMKTIIHRSLITKSICILTGMSRVPESVLKDCGLNTDKCRKGSGFGTSSERVAKSVAEEGVQEEADKFRKEILKRVSGDKAAGRDLFREVSCWEDKDGKTHYRESADAFTATWQIRNAQKKLAEHPVFGDAAQNEG